MIFKHNYLRCLDCHHQLLFSLKCRSLKCSSCGKDYQVKNNIPILKKSHFPQDSSKIFYENFNKKLNKVNFNFYFIRRWNILKKYTHISKLLSKNRILEIGIGEGNMLGALKRRVDADIIGIDFSFDLCQQAKRKLKAKNKIVCGDACYLPFADQYFDLIYSNAVLHHIDNQSRVVAESVRVCKPGGYLVFIEPKRWHPLQMLYAFFEKSEKGILKFKVRKIINYLKETRKIISTKVLPLNTFIYSYRKFPPLFLLSLVKKIEPIFDKKFLATHFIIIAQLKK